MKTKLALCLFVALALIAAACGSDDDDGDEAAPETTAEAPDDGDEAAPETTADDGDGLLAGVPEVEGGTLVGQEEIQEGGTHQWGTVDAAPGDAVAAYETALADADWTVEGSGGDPTGEFGAGVQATAPDGRYLSFNAGGPAGGTTFGDLCVWPTQPSDDNCPQGDQGDDDGGDDGDDAGPPPGVEQWIPDEVEQFIP